MNKHWEGMQTWNKEETQWVGLGWGGKGRLINLFENPAEILDIWFFLDSQEVEGFRG